jgi:hypothetical protein
MLFRPLIDIHKRGVGGNPRTPFLDKSLMVESLLGGGKLYDTIEDRVKWDGVGVGCSMRHSD